MDDVDGLATSNGLRDVCPNKGYNVSPFRRLPKERLIRQVAVTVTVTTAQGGQVMCVAQQLHAVTF